MNMIEAIEKAKKFIVDLNGEQENLQVEEVLLSDDKKQWFVTLSYYKKIQSPNELQKALGLENQRTYKRVIIDNEAATSDKEILGMYNWSFDRRETVSMITYSA